MPVTIKPAVAADAAMLATISRQTFYESFAEQNTASDMQKHLDDFYGLAKIQDELADIRSFFFLAVEDETVLGYMKLNDHPKSEAKGLAQPMELERIYALKSSIGTGVGKALMQQCFETASQQKKSTVWLGVWEHNHRAIGFYTQWGFEKFGDHIFMVGDDPQTDWLMCKRI